MSERITVYEIDLCDLLVEEGFSLTRRGARSLIQAGGVRMDGKVITDPEHVVASCVGQLLVGKQGRYIWQLDRYRNSRPREVELDLGPGLACVAWAEGAPISVEEMDS